MTIDEILKKLRDETNVLSWSRDLDDSSVIGFTSGTVIRLEMLHNVYKAEVICTTFHPFISKVIAGSSIESDPVAAVESAVTRLRLNLIDAQSQLGLFEQHLLSALAPNQQENNDATTH